MKYIKLNKRPILFVVLSLFITGIYAQDRKISGNIIDEQGEPIPGVSIIVPGNTGIGVISNADGDYSITLSPEVEILEYSFIGMHSETIELGAQLVIDIILESELIGMDEVVVIGYGTKKKSDLISSVVTVKPESMTNVPSTDVAEMLRGKAAGVYITVDDAGPGSSSTILIRGKNSIGAGNDPIVIADGVPVGSINDINPNDIASLEVLKDASAQAIYGARASNGVILITTKRAETGKAKVNYSGYYGVQTVKRLFDIYSAEEFAQLKREAVRTDNNNTYLSDEDVFEDIELEVLESGEFVDWEKEVLQIAPMQNHNLSVATGNENTKVYTSFNFLDQEGVVRGTDYKKLTVRLNLDQKVTDWLNIGLNTSWQKSEANDPGTGNTLQRTITTSPLGKIYNDDGVTYRLNPTGVQESFNPLLDIAETSNFKDDRNDIMNLFIDVTPFKGFKYRLNVSRISWDRKTSTYSSAESVAGYQNDGQGQGNIYFQDKVEWQLENIFTYNLTKGAHNLDFTFVHSVSEKEYTDFNTEASNLPNDLLGIYGLESAESTISTISANRRGLLSFVGRVQYDYAGKYYLTVSSRADASTVFGENNKWSYFPATAVGWNVHREAFMANLGVISNLKLRASYGSVGNEGIDPYESQSTAEQLDYLFDGTKRVGYVAGEEIPNPDLKWETSTTLNTAIDIGLWRNRFTATVELYNTRTKDLLVSQAINATTGYTERLSNLGEVENKGIEISMNGVVVSRKDLTVTAGVSVSANRNKIISLYGLDEDGDGVEDDDAGNSWFIGRPIDVYYQYMPVGIFQEGEDIINSHMPSAEAGDIKLYDRDPEDGDLNADDRVITEKDADWYGSFNFGVNYKSFDLSVDLMAVQGVVKDNPYLYGYSEGGSLRGVFNGVKQNYWTPENPTGNWPRPSSANDPTYIWTMGLQNASYFRIQNVTIGYTIPKKISSKIKLSKLRIYCTGHNLLTVTHYQSYSPEKAPDEYPESISFVGGVQLSF